MAAQHAGLSAERFSLLSRGQQLMAIANEMNRASKLLALADRAPERRDLVAALRAAEETDSRAHEYSQLFP
jgi:hypothetical protein